MRATPCARRAASARPVLPRRGARGALATLDGPSRAAGATPPRRDRRDRRARADHDARLLGAARGDRRDAARRVAAHRRPRDASTTRASSRSSAARATCTSRAARTSTRREVEAVYAEHPAVREIAVVGVPDAALGRGRRAYVVLAPRARARRPRRCARGAASGSRASSFPRASSRWPRCRAPRPARCRSTGSGSAQPTARRALLATALALAARRAPPRRSGASPRCWRSSRTRSLRPRLAASARGSAPPSRDPASRRRSCRRR